MRLRERRCRVGDFSIDWTGDHATSSPTRTNARGRALLAFALAVALLIPGEAMARNHHDESTTTTTTAPTQDASTTSTSSTTSTTSTTESTATTGTSQTTPADTPEPDDSLDDPLGEETDEEEPELLPLPSILFPIVGEAAYRDTYDAPRDGGARLHKGTDISAERGAPVVAVASGVVERMGIAEKAGLHVVIRHRDGWRSAYVHLNNDSPGTDNGLAMGFGPGIEVGARVEAGTVLGYVGDSGNSEDSSPHLHFELHQPDGYRANPYPALRKAKRLSEGSALATVDYERVEAEDTEMVGHIDPGSGFNAQIATLDGHVYLGTWGNEERCPGTGVRVFDVSDPTQPELVAVFADHTTLPGTAAASIWVGRVESEFFAGSLGIVGLARCGNDPITDGGDHAGLAVYDLTDPANPVLLSIKDTGVSNRGVVGLDVSTFDGQVLVGAVVSDPAVGTVAGDEVLDDGDAGSVARDSLRLFDLTDPGQPRFLAAWQPPLKNDHPQPESDLTLPGSRQRVTWLDHRTVAAGLEPGYSIVLDLTDPEQPVESWRARTDSSTSTHLLPGAVIDGRFLLVDERGAVDGEPPTGTHLIVDTSENPGTKLGNFNPKSEDDEDRSASGYYLPSGSEYHQARGGLLAWLSGGVRVIDLEDPTNPRETAFFIPAPAFDPQRWWTAPDGSTRFPMVWDVVSADGYVYVSDHHSGLWIFEITLPADPLTGGNVAN